MGLYNDWQQIAGASANERELKEFWDNYFAIETKAYKKILSDISIKYEGKVSDLAEAFDMPEAVFAGFLDGINTSLNAELDIENIETDSEISLDIDFEKLYFNMHEAKAHWLYNLNEWNAVLSEERRKEITKKWRESKQFVNNSPKVGPNEPCPCGSGKKYKKCCGRSAD
ncbi:MAG: SEC-C domain-containing protein [Christensenellaceae bacterium]|nr:SEC-C domain-containing protein [Christensenellaceae bacterium]